MTATQYAWQRLHQPVHGSDSPRESALKFLPATSALIYLALAYEIDRIGRRRVSFERLAALTDRRPESVESALRLLVHTGLVNSRPNELDRYTLAGWKD